MRLRAGHRYATINRHKFFDRQSHSNARGLPSTALKHQTRLYAGRRYATITAAGQSIASAPEYSGAAIDSITHKKWLCVTHHHATILATGHSPISRPDPSRCYSRTHQTHNAGFVQDVVKRQQSPRANQLVVDTIIRGTTVDRIKRRLCARRCQATIIAAGQSTNGRPDQSRYHR